ncbi:MAG: four helix bundle protein [Candidatus Omnitrophica bacterium]|nr:four helix bundle protein [Candidatus Omnitrophota bacterium]
MIRGFRDLEVWRKSNASAHKVFNLTETFPRAYLYDLTAQIRRAALSIPTNLSEGCVASSSKELMQFVNVAKRSVSEVQYLLCFAFERRLVEEDQFRALDEEYEEINRMLGGLRRSLKGRQAPSSPSPHSPLATRHSPLVTRHS